MGKINIILIFLILVNVSFISADIITKDGITIESDKSVYYCEPIYNQNGECLIRAAITVTNENPDQSFNIQNSFSTDVIKEPIKVDDVAMITESDRKPKPTAELVDAITQAEIPKTIEEIKPIQVDEVSITPLKEGIAHEVLILKESEPKVFYIEFWVKQNGKFDVNLNTDKNGIIILDPLYNITTNSTTPSYYLVNGTARNGSISSFASATDVYPALSDNNASTAFQTTFGGLIFASDNIAYYPFNEFAPSTILHEYSGEHDGYIAGSVSSVPGSYYAGFNFDGNDFIIVDDSFVSSHFDFTNNFTMCAKIAMNDTTERYIMNKQGAGDGFLMRVTGTGQASCTIDGVTGARTVTGTAGAASAVDNGAFHIICCVYSSPNTILYVDAIQRDILTTTAGAVSNTEDFYIGSGHLGSTFRFLGNIMELSLWNRSLSLTDVLALNSTALFNDFTKAKTIDPFFNHTTSCSTCAYYLKVTSDTNDISSVQVMAYKNSTDVNQTNFLRTNILTGESYINITSLINPTYNLPFRLWSIIGDTQTSISELSLLEVGNDTIPPSISNCSLNDTDITCGETVRGQCTITDDIGILSATGSVFNSLNLTVYPLNHLGGNIWFSDQTIFDVVPIVLNVSIDNVTATDLGGNMLTFDPNLTATYTCLPGCTPSWVVNDTICLTNDSFLRTYYDANNCSNATGAPLDNGTYLACDYCTEDLEKHYLNDCNLSGVRSFIWHDHNYLSCCIITSIVSDCSILYTPYNGTDSENCTATYHDFSLDVDSELFFGFGFGGIASDKVSGKIWLNDTNNTYSCISYVKTIEGQIIQNNPPYTKRTESTIAITQKEIEDREFFVTQNGLANVYWTNHNLVIDGRMYIFGVECSGNGQHLISEKVSTVLYKPVNEPVTRWFWAKNNMVPIMLGFLMVLIVVIMIFLIWRVGR